MQNTKVQKILTGTLLLFMAADAYSQCPNANFTKPSGAFCAGQNLNLTNTSSGATHYEWDFCAGDFSAAPKDTSFGSFSAQMTNPISLSLYKDGNQWFGCSSNAGDKSVTLLDFGNTPGNTPTVINFFNPAVSSVECNMILYKEAGNWYGLIPERQSGNLFRFDFGNSLSNSPTANNVLGGLSKIYYHDLAVDSGNVCLVMLSDVSKQVQVVSFGNSILNSPTLVSTIPVGPTTGGIYGIKAVKACDSWYAFAPDFGDNYATTNSFIFRLKFGTSLSNPSPQIDTIHTSFINGSIGIDIGYDGKGWNAFVPSYYGRSLTRLDFGNSLDNAPAAYDLGHLGFGARDFVSLAFSNSDYYVFMPYYENSGFSRIKFSQCNDLNEAIDTVTSPSGVQYADGGWHNILLRAYDDYGNVGFKLDSINVVESPGTDYTNSNTFCLGESITFSDASKFVSSAILTWQWDFGDGSPPDNSQNPPAHTYADTGLYNVSLTAANVDGCSKTIVKTIGVYKVPDADFTYTNNTCAGSDVVFTDLSSVAGSNIVSWQWDFGDGQTSSLQSPTHAYASGNTTYNVILTVQTDHGCSAVSTTKIVNILPTPVVGFKLQNTCAGGTVQFTDTSSIPSPYTITAYSWDFGDGSPIDNSQNPSHQFPAVAGTYNVVFKITASDGCTDSATIPVTITDPPLVDFSFPGTVCDRSPMLFTDESSGSGNLYAWNWDFGDPASGSANTSTDQQPYHTFTGAGTYNVTLNVTMETDCQGSLTLPVTVIQGPTAIIKTSSVCQGTVSYFYSDSSLTPGGTSIVGYLWDFGDGTGTSSAKNPTYLYASQGGYNVKLTVTNNQGCSHDTTLLYLVHPMPHASYTYNAPLCDKQTEQFTGASDYPYIIKWAWNFGDPASGTNNTSSLQNPSHKFTGGPGNYVVSLTITSLDSCVNTYSSSLTVYGSPTPDFNVSKACDGQLVYFDCKQIGLWSWNFGDPASGASNFSALQLPYHKFTKAGTYLVSLSLSNADGCDSTIVKQVSVDPVPVAYFTDTAVCLNVPHVFTDKSSVSSGFISDWVWDFGNGNTSTQQNPLFTFADTLVHNVKLTVTSFVGCSSSITMKVKAYEIPLANFTFTPPSGPSRTVTFTNKSTGSVAYSWDFGDGSQSNSIHPQHSYSQEGDYTVCLTAIGPVPGKCTDTVCKFIQVRPPLLDAAVTQVTSSMNNNNNTLAVSAIIANNGTLEITNCEVYAELSDGSSLTEYITIPIPSPGNLSYNFNASFEINPNKNYDYVCVTVKNPNNKGLDDLPLNDEECKPLSSDFSVLEPYPNPSKGEVLIQYVLPSKDNVSLILYDQIGRKAMIVYEGTGAKGLNQITFNAENLDAASYELRVTFKNKFIVKRLYKN